ncbi:2-keto-4-pentenoate hydratase [Paraburkholderia dipogonis]|uniref:2-keto-4-pentenoate hydratase n=1 Tax=Paraburkholderia dipogonis TaxID=1211383 RepID=A0A4Y8MK35_9BURK|nr:fumarylacetoacetate hydrolase family protein [Paraburkholderia dipogonis]TFE37840.1 2-keto-4-pentenoate hydratase [Paraburkholderia dipogonis]
MSTQDHLAAADALLEAARTGKAIPPLRETYPDFDGEDAYAVQEINTRRQIENGGRLIGRKIGLTARSVQRQLGVDQPDFGMLFGHMAFQDGEPIGWSHLMQLKVEAEVALVLDRDLPEPGITTAQLLRATAFALPAIEVVGSRIADWNIGFVDTVADNASSSAFVLGNTPVSLVGIDLRLAGMVMERGGDQVSLGAGAACLGHPINAAVWLANTMASRGRPLMAGDVVLTGALGPMVPARDGDVFEARIEGLGSVRAVFGGK